MKKRLLSMLLAICMTLTLLPAAAFAESAEEPESPIVIVTAADVQSMIDALPDAAGITPENRADAEDALDAIDDAKLLLTEPERTTLDFAKYDAAVAALNALDGEPGASEPATTEESFSNRLKAAAGGTYTLTKDEVLSTGYGISINYTVTIDLNGYVIKQTAASKNVFGIQAGGSLTIKDSNPTRTHTGDLASLPAGGVITGGTRGCIYMFADSAVLTLEGGTITGNNAPSDSQLSGGVNVNNGTFYMTGGSIDGNTVSHNATGSQVHIGSTAVMYANGGTVGKNQKTKSVYVKGQVKTSDSAASVTVFQGDIWNDGTVSGGTFQGQVVNNKDGSSGKIEGGTFYGEIRGGTISGGIFYGTVGDGATIADSAYVEITFNQKGGIFLSSQKVLRGQKATKPADPTGGSGVFIGWYTNDNETFDFNAPVLNSVALHAVYAENLSGATITLTNSLTYTGKEQTQNVKVVVGGQTLKEGTDYTVSGNTGTNATSYTLTITGKGGYSGTATKTWSIARADISKATVTLTNSLVYQNAMQNQTFTVTLDGNTLKSGEDYTCTGDTQKYAGDYLLTITGKGNYTGIVTKPWSIAPKAMTQSNAVITLKQDSLAYNKSTQTPEIASIIVDGITVRADEYTLTGDTSGRNAKTYTLTVNGAKNFSGSATVTWSITPLSVESLAKEDVQITFEKARLPYSGAEQTVEIKSVIVNGETPDGNWSYAVVGASNKGENAKTYTLKLQFSGNYTGTAEAEWSIAPAELTATVKQLDTLVYNGKAQSATVVTSPKGTALEKNEPKFTYSETEDGTYVESVPSFVTGEHTVYFKVEAANHKTYSGSFTVKIEKKVVTVTALDQTKHTFSYRVPKNPTEGEDYALSGLIAGDSLENVTIRIALEDGADVRKSGKYEILVSVEGEDERYAFECESGTLTVTLRPDFTLEVEKSGKPGASLTTGTSYKDADKNPNTGL